jgi:hypothetical protein
VRWRVLSRPVGVRRRCVRQVGATVTLTHVPNSVLPLNEATVDALREAIRELDVISCSAGPQNCSECADALVERVLIQETLNELAPDGAS